jgi:hypothetical protein
MSGALLASVPRPREAGPEMAALERFYADVTWTGTIEAGGMGPGTPAMTARGRGTHGRLHDGLWIVGDYRQDQFLEDGSYVLTWRLHWVTGWDADAQEYRAVLADNYGHADVLRGQIDGDRLVYETFGDGAVELRLVWDLSEPEAAVWSNERSVAGGPWTLVETYRMTRS